MPPPCLDINPCLHSTKNLAVLAKQEAYVREVSDTVNGLDNVMYERREGPVPTICYTYVALSGLLVALHGEPRAVRSTAVPWAMASRPCGRAEDRSIETEPDVTALSRPLPQRAVSVVAAATEH